MSISLTRHLIEEKRAGHIHPDLRLLIEVAARACKRISVAVGKGALGGVLGDADGGSASINIQGEAQKKLDVLSNEILLEANAWGGHLAACVSEEMEHCHPIPDAYPRGNYLLLFDPLDVNVNVGTIFSVLRCPDARRHLHLSMGQQGRVEGRQVAPDVRGQSDEPADRTGRRHIQQRPHAPARHPADAPAPARASVPRLA